MLTNLYFRLRFGKYLQNEHGIKKFAERCMGQLIRKVTKKSAFYQEMNENLMVEKANLRLRADELHERPRLDASEFFSTRRRLWANMFIVIAFVLAAVFLNALAVTSLLEGDTALMGLLQWFTAVVLAVVLTGGGLILTERLIEAIYRTENDAHRPPESTPSLGILWGVLLLGLELAILGVADLQGRILAEAGGSGLIYIGFVTLSILLPIIAGAVRWDAMRNIDRYKVTQSLREIESRLAQIDSILRQNEEYESNFYKIKSISYWDTVNEFKTYKDNYNERNGISEPIGGHFSQSYDTFQKEANKRYESDIRDMTTPSMRRLSNAEGQTGRKIGQGDRFSEESLPFPAIAPASSDNGGESSSADTYLEPKPVR